MKRLPGVALALAGLAISAGTAHAGLMQAPTFGVASVTASSTRPIEKCPATISFTAKIAAATSTDGIQYRWMRSDGGMGEIRTAGPTAGGSLTVTDTWTLDKTYQGWETVHLIKSTGGTIPDSISTAEPHAAFSLRCLVKDLHPNN